MGNNKKKVFFLSLFLVFFSSCGSHLVINPEQCESKGFWGKPKVMTTIDKAPIRFEFEESIWTPLGFFKPTAIYLVEFLKERNLQCVQLDSLEVEMKMQWYEGVLRFIPFMSRKTVVIRGLYKPESFTDEE